jgi:hypothetical protein
MSTTTKVINIGVADIVEAEAALNEELKKVEGYTSHTVAFNGTNDTLIVFGATSDGDNDGDEPATTTYVQAKIIGLPLDKLEAAEVIEEAIKDLTLVSTANAITAISYNRLLVLHEVTEEVSADDDEEQEPADEDDPKDP